VRGSVIALCSWGCVLVGYRDEVQPHTHYFEGRRVRPFLIAKTFSTKKVNRVRGGASTRRGRELALTPSMHKVNTVRCTAENVHKCPLWLVQSLLKRSEIA
jgi:hypothetical protein